MKLRAGIEYQCLLIASFNYISCVSMHHIQPHQLVRVGLCTAVGFRLLIRLYRNALRSGACQSYKVTV